MEVVWSPAALRPEYLAELNPRAAGQVVSELRKAGESLRHFPYRWRPVPGSNYRELVAIHPYAIRFRIAHDVVRVLRVRHASRRPTIP